jgi:hypothetical protein
MLLPEEIEFSVQQNQTGLGPPSTLLSSAYGGCPSIVKETGVKLATGLHLMPNIKDVLVCSSSPCMMWCGTELSTRVNFISSSSFLKL